MTGRRPYRQRRGSVILVVSFVVVFVSQWLWGRGVARIPGEGR